MFPQVAAERFKIVSKHKLVWFFMKFFEKRRKPKDEGKGRPGQRLQPRVKPEMKAEKPLAKRPLSEEMQKAKEMALEAAKWKPFAEACRAKGLKDPEKAFLDFYARVKDNPKVWALEAKVEEQVEEKGGRFNRTGFYARLFIEQMKKGKA